MAPRRLTATSVFWRTRSPADDDTRIAESNDLGTFVARPLPFNTKIPLDSLRGSPAEHVSLWLRKHGQAIKPKLTPEQIKQTQQCFRLMDADGSGAIDSGELGSAFKKIITALHERDKELLGMLSTTPRTEVADTPAQPPLTSPSASARPASASSAVIETSLKEHTALMSGIVADNARHHRAGRPLHAAASSISKQPAEAVAKRRSPRRAGCLLPEHCKQHTGHWDGVDHDAAS
ncbi:hypothetical protein WJX79_002311 [Trebouxia sp. C0005]